MKTHELFMIAIGIVFVIEGMPYAFFPGGMKKILLQLLIVPDSALRVFGFIFMALGFLLVWFVKT